MRTDLAGLFWDDRPPPKASKVVEKRTPPEPTWLSDDYLPYLAEAQKFDVPLFTREELYEAAARGEELLLDVESYPNYWLAAFRSYKSGKTLIIEEHARASMDRGLLRWVMEHFCTIGFNSNSYDVPIIELAIGGLGPAELMDATVAIIRDGMRGSEICKAHKVKRLQINHIDLIEVAPLRASLKLYGGRLHCPRMQDLPYAVGRQLNRYQIDVVRWYCINDIVDTGFLRTELKEQIALREKLGLQYGMDLRSKSDAQIAEAVIGAQVARLNGAKPKRPTIEPGTCYRYQPPAFLKYQSELMQWTLNVVTNTAFVVGDDGAIGLPDSLKELKITIGSSTYRMGIGGLHSSEQRAVHKADSHTLLIDRDVASYYPAIMLNTGLYPQHLGQNFLRVYADIVKQRLDAKKRGDKVAADSLKITINGTFGKLGSPYSTLYAPNLLIQVTVTGQLSLLMLIERLELAGVSVVSANTDGLVIKCPVALKDTMDAVVANWERDTGFETEATEYQALYSRDVNNYIAVKSDGKIKSKGAYANPWSDPKLAIFKLHKNPQNPICIEAVEGYLAHGRSLASTIKACTDIRKFVTIRTVKGGAVKNGVYLGKAIRWYYAAGEQGEIVYALTGNKVPRSDGAKPLMDLPPEFPVDVDYARYEAEAEKLLSDLGVDL